MKPFFERHRKVIYAVLFLLAFTALLGWSLYVGMKPVPTPFRDRNDSSAVKHILETSFAAWHRGDSNQLLASFNFENHTDKTISRITVVCQSYLPNGTANAELTQVIPINLAAGEIRHLYKQYIGDLDALADTVDCTIDNWE